MASSLLSVTKLVVAYGPAVAVDGVTLEVADSECVAVVGANGAGKSTMLKAIAGLLRPQSGHVRFDGVDVTGRRSEALAKAGLGMVPEGRQIFARLTVKDNLELGGHAARLSSRRRHQRIGELLELFPDLRSRLADQAGGLSGGQQQMLAIARALMSRPRLLLMDEPSLGLAPKVCDVVFAAISSLATSGIGILLVEQNATLAFNVARRGYVIDKGRVVMEDSAASLIENPAVREHYLGIRLTGQSLATNGERAARLRELRDAPSRQA